MHALCYGRVKNRGYWVSDIMTKMHLESNLKHVEFFRAGVSGLTTALLLSRSPDNYHITVTAKFMPGDYDIEYASPWAGANYLP